MKEAALWLGRALKLLPELVDLWNAVDAKSEQDALEAALALRRKISDQQMREMLEP